MAGNPLAPQNSTSSRAPAALRALSFWRAPYVRPRSDYPRHDRTAATSGVCPAPSTVTPSVTCVTKLPSAGYAEEARRAGALLRFIRDSDDDHVIACALAARAQLIVSRDKDLLDLHPYQGIPILASAEPLQHLDAKATEPSAPAH